MTAIGYGGGPTVEQRKQFCNLLPGSHIPGYMGNVPQYKFSHGNTFGKQTSKIASGEVYVNPRVGDGKISATLKVFKDEIPRDRIPKSTGDNRFTDKMIPGYAGTYSQLADECVDEFVTQYNKHEKEQRQLRDQSGLFPKLKPISDDPRVRDHVNMWVDDYLQIHGAKLGPRGPTESPATGYAGYIPKAIPANFIIGCTYPVGVVKSLEAFRTEVTNHFGRLKLPVEPLKPEPDSFIPKVVGMKDQPISYRLYRNDGILPNYASHAHGQAFTSGRTQGDITRQLEICRHHYPSYGLYLKNKDLAKESC